MRAVRAVHAVRAVCAVRTAAQPRTVALPPTIWLRLVAGLPQFFVTDDTQCFRNERFGQKLKENDSM